MSPWLKPRASSVDCRAIASGSAGWAAATAPPESVASPASVGWRRSTQSASWVRR